MTIRRKCAVVFLLVLFWGGLFGEAVSASKKKVAPAAFDLYIFDAHSQIPEDLSIKTIIKRMDANGVYRTILSANSKRDPADIAAFTAVYPRRIIAAVRIKGGRYRKENSEFYQQLDEQAESVSFGAMAEVMIWHTPKRGRDGKTTFQSANYYNALPSDGRVQAALKHAVARGWPFVMHIEFGGLLKNEGEERRDLFMKALERFLDQHPRQFFVLNKMGQLSSTEVGRLIRAHPNIHFMTDHSTNPEKRRAPKNRFAEPWVNLFLNKEEFAPEWSALFMRHSGHFIFALDMVRDKHWKKINTKEPWDISGRRSPGCPPRQRPRECRASLEAAAQGAIDVTHLLSVSCIEAGRKLRFPSCGESMY